MRARPLLGPVLVLAGGLGLLLASLQTWYAVDTAKLSVGARFAETYARQNSLALDANAWEPFGYGSDLLLLMVIAGAVTLGAVGIASRGSDPRAALGALVTGGVGTALVLLHLLSRPKPSEIVVLRGGAWLGLLCCLVVLGGAFVWWDRAQHPDRAHPPHPRRPPADPFEPFEPFDRADA